MQYVRNTFGSLKSTYNSINPATLSGAIDVVCVEHEDGSYSCSPFHVRFGKLQLLRPSEKKVTFIVNNEKQDLPMKLGEGGEAFFVFETTDRIPYDQQTSPLASPETSPQTYPNDEGTPSVELQEPEPLDIAADTRTRRARSASPDKARLPAPGDDGRTDMSALAITGQETTVLHPRPQSGDWSGITNPHELMSRSSTDETVLKRRQSLVREFEKSHSMPSEGEPSDEPALQGEMPTTNSTNPDVIRATALSRKLWNSRIPSTVTEEGDIMLHVSGWGDTEADSIKLEAIARKVMSEDLADEDSGNHDIGSRIGLDEDGNIWVYHSEEAKAAADRRAGLQALKYSTAIRSYDAISDPGYHSDEEGQSDTEQDSHRFRRDSDSAVGVTTPPDSPPFGSNAERKPTTSYAKTLRLTSDQLKSLSLKSGPNPMTFTVNRSTCPAVIYLWRHDVPIVISDIDGTITKSDVVGQLFTAIGRDWTHLGVAKLYTDISQNGYNILYLTSRSVGQADTTRNYLNGVSQENYKLPRGPVIMSPDRTYAALRREVILRKPEVFKMACLRDIMGLFQTGATETHPRTPFYAGFGNRVTDAMSYRSVSIPSARIFTIDTNAQVSMHLLALDSYRTSYVSMRELVDHYFPPVSMLVKEGGEEYTDFNYWRDKPLERDEFSASESGSDYDAEEEDDDDDEGGYRPSIDESVRSEDDAEGESMEASFYSHAESVDDGVPGYDEGLPAGYDEQVEGGILQDAAFNLNADPETMEIELDDAENSLGALDLASEATPHVGPQVDPVMDDLRDLAKVLNEPERRASG